MDSARRKQCGFFKMRCYFSSDLIGQPSLKVCIISLFATTRSISLTYKYLWLLYESLIKTLWLRYRILQKGILQKREKKQEIVDSSK